MTTKTRLSRETMAAVVEHVNNATLTTGMSDNINHEDCPAGTDTRERLYIKVTEDSKLILAHCFNCGGSGVRGTSIHVRPFKSHEEALIDNSKYLKALCDYHKATVPEKELFGDFAKNESSYHVWPFYMMDDCSEAFIEADFFGIRYDKDYVYIPRGEGCGLEIRARPSTMVKSYKGPKWNRVLNPTIENTSSLLIYNRKASDTAIVVEDPVSAMKVCLAGYAGVALCGSTLSTDDAFKIGMLFKQAVVWLDNDKAEILKASHTIRDRISLFVNPVRIITKMNDPKLYTVYEIDTAIREILK